MEHIESIAILVPMQHWLQMAMLIVVFTWSDTFLLIGAKAILTQGQKKVKRYWNLLSRKLYE